MSVAKAIATKNNTTEKRISFEINTETKTCVFPVFELTSIVGPVIWNAYWTMVFPNADKANRIDMVP